MCCVDATTLATTVIEADGNPKKNPTEKQKHTVFLSAQVYIFSAGTLHTPTLPTAGLRSQISHSPVGTPHHAVALMAE